MKRFALIAMATTALSCAALQVASAADIPAPVYKAAVVAPAFSWSGCYVGVNAGVGWNHSDFGTNVDPGSHFSVAANLALINAAGTGTANKTGFVGGGQIGCNWQTGAIVYGVEGDFNAFSATATLEQTAATTLGPVTMTNSMKTNWLATARARVGYAFDRSLIYVTGGVAFADLRYTETWSEPAFPAFGTSTVSKTKAGAVIGAGWEYAFTNNWSAKAEYLHVRFGSVSNDWLLTTATGTTNAVHGSAKLSANIFRLGLNYKLWGG